MVDYFRWTAISYHRQLAESETRYFSQRGVPVNKQRAVVLPNVRWESRITSESMCWWCNGGSFQAVHVSRRKCSLVDVTSLIRDITYINLHQPAHATPIPLIYSEIMLKTCYWRPFVFRYRCSSSDHKTVAIYLSHCHFYKYYIIIQSDVSIQFSTYLFTAECKLC